MPDQQALPQKATGIVAVIGAGGRESAIAWKLSQSSLVKKLIIVPGSGYTASKYANKVENGTFQGNLEEPVNFDAFSQWCIKEQVSLVVIGPEGPLAAGLADYLNGKAIPCFGPTKKASRLEWDKAYAKQFFDEHGIPAARWRAFTDSTLAEAFIREASFQPFVIKASGLAAGKGVVIVGDRDEGSLVAHSILDDKRFGDAGSTIVVEEKLDGPEVSILCFTDGTTVIPMPAAQDAKRIGEGDTGPNTGGMGAYVPVHPSILSKENYDTVVSYVQKTVDNLSKSGDRYVGVLYAGIMLTKDGPKFLEYNCRFGDPETEALLPLLESDLYEVLQSCVSGTLAQQPVKFRDDQAAVCVVLASEGYPSTSPKSKAISFKRDAKNFSFGDNAFVFPAGVSRCNGGLATNGGRVAMVVGIAGTILQASTIAQQAADDIVFEGKQKRKDIGYQSVLRTVTQDARLTYKSCDVDIDEGDRLVADFILPLAKQTSRLGLLEGVGGFGGLFDLTSLDYKEPVLVSGTDGVGTKLLIAEEIGRHETIGIDLVAMSVNDILTHNAEPLYFLDYFATGKLTAETAGLVLKGITDGCLESNCTLIGGETAEMPGMYPAGRYDLAGFAVGVVEKSKILPSVQTIGVGDVILGIASSGIHSNGYSLVRKVVADAGLSYDDIAPFSSTNRTLGEELLTPTKIYIKSVLPALRSGHVKAAAHITGGGLTENIPRILPKHSNALLFAKNWPLPPVFSWLSLVGRVSADEMARTFNVGIGMVLIVDAKLVDTVQKLVSTHGETAFRIGEIVEGRQKTEIFGLESSLLSSYMSWAVKVPVDLSTRKKRRVGILLSGTGTNMEALVAYSRDPKNHSAADVVVVISNIATAKGVEKAKGFGIPVEIVDHKNFARGDAGRSQFDQEINDTLERHDVELVCLAGYMRICSSVFVQKWRGRCINTHPALLPAFKGKDAVQYALDARARVTGCTVHFVEEEVDGGGIILQHPVPIFPEDTHDSLHERIKTVEHQIFPKSMEAVCRGDAVRDDDGNVQWKNFRHYMSDTV